MIKVDNIQVWGFEHTVRGMRNPMNSWSKSDSHFDNNGNYQIGENDLKLMQNLYKASLDQNHAHRKYLRQIMVSMDIVAPLYWWKEFDTYKIGVVANSCSTMHTLHKKLFETSDFSCEYLISTEGRHGDSLELFEAIISKLNYWLKKYLETQDKKYWWQLIQLLPNSYNQRRTVTMNYENAIIIIKQREGHKLDEWNVFVEELKKLPYLKEITEVENE